MSKAFELKEIDERLTAMSYMTEPDITMAIYLAMHLEKPLLIEGPAGVGKTEVAKVVAELIQTEVIRLQCYDGIDAQQAIYEWNYQHQLMYLKLLELKQAPDKAREDSLYDERFLLQRPLLKAIMSKHRSVLLIDEIDRADEAFESFLLEILSDWQVSIPEIGTISAKSIPVVILTSNATRELSDALRRRCMYLYINYPSFEKELAILRAKVPEVETQLLRQVCHFMESLRSKPLHKHPGVAETLDWARALAQLHYKDLDREGVASSLGLILKDWKDKREIEMSLSELLQEAKVKSKIG